jgi:hypothetical protein
MELAVAFTLVRHSSQGLFFEYSNRGTVLWDTSGIKIYFFPRGSIPSDISAGAPQPSKWPAPMANFPSTDCNPYQFFNTHSTIFDTTLWYVYVFIRAHDLNILMIIIGIAAVIGQEPFGTAQACLGKM